MCQVCNTRQSQWRITSVKLYWLYYRVCLLRYVVPVIRILIVCYWYVSDENVQQTTLLAVNVHFILHPQACICKPRKGTKAYIHGNLFGTTARSIRCILQPEKRLRNEHYKVHSAIYLLMNLRNVRVLAPPIDVVLTLNFGDNANHSYSHRFKPLTKPRVP